MWIPIFNASSTRFSFQNEGHAEQQNSGRTRYGMQRARRAPLVSLPRAPVYQVSPGMARLSGSATVTGWHATMLYMGVYPQHFMPLGAEDILNPLLRNHTWSSFSHASLEEFVPLPFAVFPGAQNPEASVTTENLLVNLHAGSSPSTGSGRVGTDPESSVVPR